MGLFGGPSRKVLDNITSGIAATIIQEYGISKFQNTPFYHEIFANIVATAQELKLGFIAKAKFLATIRAKLIMLGMSQVDADYLQGLIEIEMRSTL